jgi:hypothetical protein
MAVITDWGTAFLTAIANAFSKLFGFLPDLIGALLILWIGWMVAGWLSKLVANVLRKIRFNEAADKAGVSRFIQASGVRKDASGVMGEIVKWFFRLIALVAAFSVLQLPALTAALTGILNFIPNLFVALVIILVGGLLATFVGDFVKGAASSAGFGNANLVANIARYAILYVAVIAALGQLGIAETVINTIFIGTVAALALGIGLAFGLGGRETAGRIWENMYNSAQENLPKFSQGMQRQSQTQKQRLQQGLQQAAQTVNRASGNHSNEQQHPNLGYAASGQGQSQGTYNNPPTSPASGGYYNGGQNQGGYYAGGQDQGNSGSYYGQGQERGNEGSYNQPNGNRGTYNQPNQPSSNQGTYNQPNNGGYYDTNQDRPNQGGYYGNSGQSQSRGNQGGYYDTDRGRDNQGGEIYNPDRTDYPRP